jgi:hypothetical protein
MSRAVVTSALGGGGKTGTGVWRNPYPQRALYLELGDGHMGAYLYKNALTFTDLCKEIISI